MHSNNTIFKFSRGLIFTIFFLTLSACGGGSTSTSTDSPEITTDNPEVTTDSPELTDETIAGIVSAKALSKHFVEIEFSKPQEENAEDASNYQINDPNEIPLSIESAELSSDKTRVLLTTGPQQEVAYTLSTQNLAFRASPSAVSSLNLSAADVRVRTNIIFNGSIALEPYVLYAISLSNTELLVTVSSSIQAPDVSSNELDKRYFQLNNGLVITKAELVGQNGEELPLPRFTIPTSGLVIKLTTLGQEVVQYDLKVTNIYKRNSTSNTFFIGSPSGFINPLLNTTTFLGTAASATFDDAGQLVNGIPDTDGDGIADLEEQRGYPVVVFAGNGETTTRNVTSNPFLKDTDGDGVSDADERQFGSDARSVDTDGDTLSDNLELNTIISSPFKQDSDGDGLEDGLEYNFYQTSPILADTDGDKQTDTEELLEFNRNPRIADLPQVKISVGEVRLQLDETYSYTDEQGDTVTQESTSNTTLAKSQNTSFSQSNGGITEIGGGLEVRAGFGNGSFFGGDKGISGGVEATGNVFRNNTTSWQNDNESAQESQKVYEQSLAKGRELNTTSTVTREVNGGRIDIDLSISNSGDVAFTVSNLEVTVLQRSRLDTRRFVPVATLISNSELITNESLKVNLGPFNSERGPFLFTSREVFPNLLEELMKRPQGLIFKVANYDVTDEFGRNFVFSDQTARDRTAGIHIDFGDARAATRRLVATSGAIDNRNFINGGFMGGFDSEGAPLGMPLDYVLQDILGMGKHDRVADIIVGGLNNAIDSIPGGDDVAGVDGGGKPVIKTGPNGWLETQALADDYVANPTEENGIVAGLNKTSDSIAQGDDIQLIPADTTGLSVGSIVISAGSNGILDTPHVKDDRVEFVAGYETSRSCDATSNKVGNICQINADCECKPGDEATDLRCVASPAPVGSCNGPEKLVRVDNMRNGDFNRTWLVLHSGQVPAAANFGSILVKPGEDLFLAFMQDLDRDGLFARDEFLAGSTDSAADKEMASDFGVSYDPDNLSACTLAGTNVCDGLADSKDTDRDGLGDYSEVRLGWKVSADGGPLVQAFSSPRLRDSDGDTLLDPEEADLRSFCNSNDYRVDALCAFQSQPPVLQAQAIGIIVGPDGIANSTVQGDDVQLLAVNAAGLAYGTPVIGAGPDGQINTPLLGDDQYESITSIPPATDPSQRDTDGDNVNDNDELKGYAVGLAIKDGINGIAETERNGDDLQKAQLNNPVKPGGVVILPGDNGVLDSAPVGDDTIHAAIQVMTDPLRRDTDTDTITDGLEVSLGSNPAVVDGADFRDGDQDGLTDSEETDLGWLVAGVLVKSSASLPDTDFDGLPDVVERDLRTNPNKVDTDGDGLSDFDELYNFEKYITFTAQFPGVEINGSSSKRYGTNPLLVDTDGDTLFDYAEVIDGYQILVPGESALRQIHPSPLTRDTDLDGVDDNFEIADKTDATSPDTDGDGRTDGQEKGISDPLVPDVAIEITIDRIIATKVTGDGANELAEMTWWFTTQGPNDTAPVLLTSPQRAVPFANYIWGYSGLAPGEPQPTNCYWHPMTAGNAYTLTTTNSSRTITLRQGQSFALNGLIAEIDDVSRDCNQPPNYIPSWIDDEKGCIAHLNELFSYDDFVGGASSEILKAQATDKCTIEVQYSIETK